MENATSTKLNIYRFIVRPRCAGDPRSAGLLADAHALGLAKGMTIVEKLACQDLYFIEGQVSESNLQRIALELLSDPITQTAEWGRLIFRQAESKTCSHTLEVALRPGVTDPVAEQIVRASGVLGIEGVQRVCTGQRYQVGGKGITEETLHLLARRLLANPVIQRYAIGEIEPVFPQPAAASSAVEVFPVRELDDDGLLALSQERRAALDLVEMHAVQDYFRREGREVTDIEFEMIAQTWSEHCVHKTFRALVDVHSAILGPSLFIPGLQTNPGIQKPAEQINGLLKTYIRAATEKISAPWVLSAFVDNAGIIEFDDEFEVSFKVETHNHPSAIEPFGGANTGVGGVIRDVMGVSAKPIAATDVLCFGPQDLSLEALPDGVLHPRRIQSRVVAGVQDYGNKIGIPTVNGAILYDPGYTANPLVFCGCVGIAPRNSHPRQPLAGDRVIVLGGRTGRDGLRGATFSSQTMDAQTGEVAGASVQIGAPIIEKGGIEVILRARDTGLYHAVTDCGAGGLSSAVGEMSSLIGATIELKDVRLKYPGLAPWEIWLSEAQERMVVAVSPADLPALQTLCDTYDVELTDIGEFTNTRRLIVHYDGQVVLNLENEFLHEGIPQRKLTAVTGTGVEMLNPYDPTRTQDPNTTLIGWLSKPNVASKEAVIRIYDHEVQGGTVVKPLTGAQNDGPADACVLKPIGAKGKTGIVLSNGINPEYGKLNAYNMAVSVIDEAIRNAVAVGCNPDRIALLDNFCWGDPLRPENMGSLVEAARGCYDAALYYQAPFISGKDSLNNEYLGTDGLRHAIPPTLLISAIGLIEDVSKSVTMDLKEPGNSLYLLGRSEITGSAPGLPEFAPTLYRALHQAMKNGLVRACHDLCEGGLGTAIAEMCIGGRLGASLDVQTSYDSFSALFGETNGCLLAEVCPQNCVAFEEILGKSGSPFHMIGVVNDTSRLEIAFSGTQYISLPVPALVDAWKGNTHHSPVEETGRKL